MEECIICVSYVFEIREQRTMDLAAAWRDHLEGAHRGTVVTLRAAEALVEVLRWAEKAREAMSWLDA